MEGLRMISYYDGQLADILPGNIKKKPEVEALSYALQQACRQIYQYSQRLYIFTNLESQPEEIIDLLASELRTQYYKSDLPLDAKRQLVKNTLIWYMSAGTPKAVEELVATIFGKGKVKEWFEYGDNPFFFKIETDAVITQEMNDFFSVMIQHVKNTRSHLRAIEIDRKTYLKTLTGGASYSWSKPAAILDGYEYTRKTTQDICTGVGTGTQIQKAIAIIEN